jgi:hypothetical protein
MGARIEIPTKVSVGAPFQATIYSYGDGCVSKGETEIDVKGLRALVTPYDYGVPPGRPVACLSILNLHSHDVTLRFDRQGLGWVTFRGQRQPSGEMIDVTSLVVVE